MSNPMDIGMMQQMPDFESLVRQAQQNPQAFENYLRQSNPQAYQQAMQIRGCQNPRAVILQMAQNSGVNPNILKMFGVI